MHAAERARTRGMVAMIDEAATGFGPMMSRGEPALFICREMQNRETAGFAAEAYVGRLRLLDQLSGETDGPFLTGGRVKIADCIAGATSQFPERFYGVPLPGKYPVLEAWYTTLAVRPSMTAPAYPEPLPASLAIRLGKALFSK